MNFNLLGTKLAMTQIFNSQGIVIPATIILAGPCYITQLKTIQTVGYNAIQLGYLEIKENKLTKPKLGHLKKNDLVPLRYLKEFKVNTIDNYYIGQKLCINIFKIGQKVNISGLSIGKGFIGNIKANHFQRGGMSHGSKHHRLQGSLGAGTSPGRVFPGKKMPKRFGNEQRTIKNLEILNINLDTNLLLIKGSIPGKSGTLVSLSSSN